MKRFKILAGTTLLILLYIAAFTYINKQREDLIDIEKSALILSSEQIKINKEKELRYLQNKEELYKRIRLYFEKEIKSGGIVGAGISIVKGDSIILSDGFGKRDIHKKERVNGETVFRLGSLSKGFTGILTADLKEEGKLNWNDKITDYLPDFHFGDDENTSHIKLAHILSHTSGTAYHSFTNLVEAGLPITTIAKRFNAIKPISEPGQVYSYQNAMFSLSQEVIKKTTGNEITMALKNRFFKPLGMSTVSMDHKALLSYNNVALPHTKGTKGWRSLPLTNKYYNAVSAGGINASSLDMAKWMRFLLGHNPEVMRKNAIGEVFKPFIELKGHRKYYQRWPGHVKSAYGFGWRIHEFKDHETNESTTMWHHGGSVNNYRNEIAVYPESDLGICVLLNGNSKLARNVIPDLHDIVKKVYSLSLTKKEVKLDGYAALQATE
ncbi:serine hydrolase domain-containing protein [uncultured Maribacter sp.]|uniref:serine hydrolase domain-containing protein n=1 Tax=uncultured Maribacter sp. TaxID=431308 RepID=UPI00260904EC|nr:serine hydrolase domain-containing protein [uncultured Maribacter sp.]